MPLAISLSQEPASFAALGAVAAFLLVMRICGAKFQSLLVGADQRTSTSKFQALLWTLLLAWALLTLTFQGRTGFNLVPDYLALLGFPVLALVFAKGIVQQKLEQGDLAKPPPSSKDPAAGATTAETAHSEAQQALATAKAAAVSGNTNQAVAAAEQATQAADTAAQAATAAVSGSSEKRNFFSYFGDLVNNDAGKADIADFQYVVFNLVAATYFLFTFIDSNVLPQIPETLLALTGVSAATYVTNKAVLKQKPTLTGVSPASAAPGKTITLLGVNLAAQGSKPDGTPTVTDVKFDETSVAPSLVSDEAISVAVPANVAGYTAGTAKAVHIKVLNAAGLESNQVAFTIA